MRDLGLDENNSISRWRNAPRVGFRKCLAVEAEFDGRTTKSGAFSNHRYTLALLGR